MNKLERIKIRLLKRLKTSQEDWWEDLRNEYLGDNFLDNGPADVAKDFEIAEELELEQGSWSHILYRTDETMIPYRNIYGNSGVAMYEGGSDWFLVKFKDGSLYLYTTRSTTMENIEKMRRYGYEGAGLNRFINLHVGNKYAGKNYKGALTMMPGMESINDPLAYRALQLILAHENTRMKDIISENITHDKLISLEEQAGHDGLEPLAQQAMNIALELFAPQETVSNESLWGAVKYLFGGNYEDLPKVIAAYDESVDVVKSTYGNPEWVKKRRLNTGKPIKVSPYGEVAADPKKAFDKMKQANNKAVSAATQYVKEEVEYLSKFTKVLTSGDNDKIKALLEMFEKRNQVDLEHAPILEFAKDADVKGMDAKQIHQAAEIFIEAVKYRRTTDALYSQGMYKLLYTDSGKERYGRNGEVTAKLDGPAKELSILIGLNGLAVEESFFNSFTSAWDNVDHVVRGTLKAMEASAD